MTTRALSTIVLVACSAPAVPPPARPPAPARSVPPAPSIETPAATEIVSKMEHVYSSMTSYVDHADVSTVVGRRPPRESQFEIAFVRGGVLRVNESRSGQGGVLWWDGTQALSHQDGRAVEKTTLAHAFTYPTSILSTEALTVPGMLVSDALGRAPFSKLDDLRLLGSERVMNRDCWKLQGTYGSHSTLTFWVDRETFLLRRADNRLRSQHSRMSMTAIDSTTTHNPVINGPVDPTLLQRPAARGP